MRHPNIPKIPNCLGRLTVDSLTEESELEAKASALRSSKIPRVVPPFGLKFRMVEMVAREFEAVIGKRQPIWVIRRLRTHRQPQHQRKKPPAILHGSLRWAPGGSHSWPGKGPKAALRRKQSITHSAAPAQANETEWSIRRTAC